MVMADQLIDTFGRVHRDLRISVTDRCNFRCTYCMPEEGVPTLSHGDILSYEEMERVVRIATELANQVTELGNEIDALTAQLREVEAEFDGKGRVILRPSGTEPLIRVTLEGADKPLVESLAEQLADTVRSELGA